MGVVLIGKGHGLVGGFLKTGVLDFLWGLGGVMMVPKLCSLCDSSVSCTLMNFTFIGMYVP